MDLDNTHEESVIVVATRPLTPLQSFLALASPKTCHDDCTGLLNADTDGNPPDIEYSHFSIHGVLSAFLLLQEDSTALEETLTALMKTWSTSNQRKVETFGEILCGTARNLQATSSGLDDGEAEKGNESEIDIQSKRPAVHAAGLKNANDIESLTPKLTQHDPAETTPGPSQTCINESLAQQLAPLRHAVANEFDEDLEQVDQGHNETDHSKLGDEPPTVPLVEDEESPKDSMIKILD